MIAKEVAKLPQKSHFLSEVTTKYEGDGQINEELPEIFETKKLKL